MHGNVKKNMDDNLPFQAVVSFFLHIVPWGVSQDNRHLLILDGHGFHVII
jgi:hypothetical protein